MQGSVCRKGYVFSKNTLLDYAGLRKRINLCFIVTKNDGIYFQICQVFYKKVLTFIRGIKNNRLNKRLFWLGPVLDAFRTIERDKIRMALEIILDSS